MEMSNSLGISEPPLAQVPQFGGFSGLPRLCSSPAVHNDHKQTQGHALNMSTKQN